MKFIHISDLHLVAPGGKLWGFDPLKRLEACLSDIATHHGDAVFCAISGDLAERGEVVAYQALKDLLSQFPLPTYLALGNHDDRESFFRVFSENSRDAKGFAQSAAQHDGVAVLTLDTLKGPPSSAGLYGEDRRAWLKAELARAGEKPVIIFMHHPPFDIGHELMDLIKLEDGEGLHRLLSGRNIKHIFFGHAHRPISGQWRGIPFTAVPSLAHQLPLAGGSVPTVYSDEPPMYAVVLVEPDRTIVHFDAFLNRAPAEMDPGAERETWF
ncbi:MAG: phosphodiesterase [Rhizobiales bacterium]|nr:phosphodiesterase [Hyphomicrobiales bacterium]